MKILLANKFFFQKGGAETVFFQEREHLLNEGHTVMDFSMDHPENLPSPYTQYFIPNINYRVRPKSNILTRSFLNASDAINFIHNKVAVENIKRLIDTEKPAIAHLHNIYHQITPSIIPVLRKRGIKVVLTLHDYKIICPNYLMLTKGQICEKCGGETFWHAYINNCEQSSYTKSLLLAIEAYWHKFFNSYQHVDIFLTPSRFMADIVSQFTIKREKIKVLYNGIDTRKFLATDEDGEYALYFGRISREKGVGTFLSAHLRLNGIMSAKVVGTGPLASVLEKKYKQASFLGFKQGQELRKLIKKASFIVVPSEWYENCSMTVLEAMAMGKPVIGSRIGGIPEQIEDGITGFLFEMGNIEELTQKMTILGSDAGLRKQMGHAARIKIERDYSLTKHNQRLLQIYSNLLE